MSLRRLSVLQWIGFLVPPIVWISQHVTGYGIGEARCSIAGMHWGIGFDVWQLTLLSCAGLAVVGAEVAAILVFLRTRGADFGDGPAAEGRWGGRTPYGRLHFFATAAMIANVLFLSAMLMDGIGSASAILCRQS